MKVYCKDCQKKLPIDATACKCGASVDAEPVLTDEEVRPFIQKLHKKTNDLRHLLSHCLSFVVIGLILLVIAFFFYYLAFGTATIDGEKVAVLNTKCSEFWVSMVALITGGAAFLGGAAIGTLVSYKKRQILFDIDQIRETHSLQVKSVDIIFVVWFKAIAAKIRHLIWVLKYKKSVKEEK